MLAQMDRLSGRDLGELQATVLKDLLAQASRTNPRSPRDEVARWFDSKPPFADWFTRSEPLTLLANATKTEITAFVIPNGYYGVLRFFGNVVGNVSDYPSVTFAVEIDGAPLAGFASIKGPISPALNAPIAMMDALLSGQRVRVVASNSTASSISNVQAFLRGWYWPIGKRE